MSAILQRETFQVSRLMEFFTERELTAQMGFNRDYWPVALLKELVDNALDAAERSGRPPEIIVTLEPDALIVQDNGPGLPLGVIERSLDYSVRVSDKTGYVSPTRGQQGNALKTLWAAPFVATDTGQIDVETAGQRYQVQVTLDRIAQRPQVNLAHLGGSDVKNGTRIVLHWTGIAGYLNKSYPPNFYTVLVGATALNPHLTLTAVEADWRGTNRATDPGWAHWSADRPTSPHWYSRDHLRHLIALLLDADRRSGGRTRSVNEFVRQFNGLSSTLKAAAVTKAAGLHGTMLSDLIRGGDLAPDKVGALLLAMQQEAKPVKPEALGMIGEAHCRHALQNDGISSDSITYRAAKGTVNGLPYVVEVAFGIRPEDCGRHLVTGVNFSPAFRSPFQALDEALNEAQINYDDPVELIVHLVCPRMEYIDRGKTRAQLPAAISEALVKSVKLATKRWTDAKRRADREGRIRESDRQALLKAAKAKELTAKDATYQVMEQAYLKASSGGTLPANARQIMYAARPAVIELTGKANPWKGSSYFTQTLLPDFVDEHPELTADWDVVFDARGHFAEPHTDFRIGVGTLAVRRYLKEWHDRLSWKEEVPTLPTNVETNGPALRYRHVLFIEKEGFTELLNQAQIAERYDLALLSTKGLSVTAARKLIDSLSQNGVTIMVLHDFDESGFKILHTLKTDTRRYQFETPPNVDDIGLRLTDVQAMRLQAEEVEYNRKEDPRPFLISRGATEEEAKFLVGRQRSDGHWLGQRVELNAMTSDEFIRWLEAYLEAHGVTKFIPDETVLQEAWKRAWRINRLNEALVKADKELGEPPATPPDLRSQVEQHLKEHPTDPWDEAIAAAERQHAEAARQAATADRCDPDDIRIA